MHPSRAVRRLGRRNRGSTVQGLGDELGDEPADELCDGAAQLVTDGRLERLLRRGHTPESTTAESLPALAVACRAVSDTGRTGLRRAGPRSTRSRFELGALRT
jgi:hypothetical protein